MNILVETALYSNIAGPSFATTLGVSMMAVVLLLVVVLISPSGGAAMEPAA